MYTITPFVYNNNYQLAKIVTRHLHYDSTQVIYI